MIHADTQTQKYEGEVRPRTALKALVLTYICPGLAYMYSGQFWKALCINLFFVTMLVGFVAFFAVTKFFPLWPGLVLIMAWLIFSTLFGMRVVETIRIAPNRYDKYVLKNYNHWLFYGLFALLTYFTPVAAVGHWVSNHLMTMTRVSTSAMYPTIYPNDTVLIDTRAYQISPPKRGDVVAIQDDDHEQVQLLRVVAVENDIISVSGPSYTINDELIPVGRLKPEFISGGQVDPDSELLAMVENNRDRRYVISVSPRVISEISIEPFEIPQGTVFLLADNRSQVSLYDDATPIRDSRIFGPLEVDRIIGKPLYIAWSVHPLSDSTRWERIGLHAQ